MSLPPELSEPRLLRLWDVLPEARVVGGAVRDFLAGLPIADIDLATPRLPDEVIAVLRASELRSVPTGISHGTITVVVEGEPFEITTLRRDIETDGRHATVAYTDDWKADAERRDFTFNAMSLDRSGCLYDYFGGLRDLNEGKVRFVGDATTRISEDYLRILRFFRFFARFGIEVPTHETLAALERGIIGLQKISRERIGWEVRKILWADDPRAAISLMDRTLILDQIFPGPTRLSRFNRVAASDAPPDHLLRLSAITDASSYELAQRFKLSRLEQEVIEALRSSLPKGSSASERILRWLFLYPNPEVFLMWTWLNDEPDLRLHMVKAGLQAPVFPILGRDLLSLGWQPGRELGRQLASLRRDWERGGFVATRDELLAKLAPPPAG